jgi:hypothetical protein
MKRNLTKRNSLVLLTMLFLTIGCNKKDTSTPEPIAIKGKATVFSLQSTANIITGGGAIVQADDGKMYTVSINSVDAGNGDMTMTASSSPFISNSATTTNNSTSIFYSNFGSNTLTITPKSPNFGNVSVKSIVLTISNAETTTMGYTPTPFFNATAAQFNQLFQNLISKDMVLIVNSR